MGRPGSGFTQYTCGQRKIWTHLAVIIGSEESKSKGWKLGGKGKTRGERGANNKRKRKRGHTQSHLAIWKKFYIC